MEPRIAIPLALSPADLAAFEPRGRIATLEGETMGTRWSVRFISASDPSQVRASIQRILASIVQEMSQWEPESDLSRFNRAPPGSWRRLPPQFHEVLSAALAVARDSNGAFDPTIGALVDRWGFGPVALGEIPSEDEIGSLRARCGWTRIEIDPAARRALQPGGIGLDLSGIAKGYAVDRIGAFLSGMGCRHFLVEIGGELLGRGIKPDGQPWWVDLEAPPASPLPPVRVALHGLAAATSGCYRRWFDQGGRRYSHSLDPRTGAPIESDIASVTILHPSCMMADAYATAITVLGPAAGAAFAAARDLAAHILTRDGNGWSENMSPRFAAMLD